MKFMVLMGKLMGRFKRIRREAFPQGRFAELKVVGYAFDSFLQMDNVKVEEETEFTITEFEVG